MLTRLFTKLISDELTEFSYDAECAGLHYRYPYPYPLTLPLPLTRCAGLHYRVYNSAVGLNLMLAGYSHKLPVLLTKVL